MEFKNRKTKVDTYIRSLINRNDNSIQHQIKLGLGSVKNIITNLTYTQSDHDSLNSESHTALTIKNIDLNNVTTRPIIRNPFSNTSQSTEAISKTINRTLDHCRGFIRKKTRQSQRLTIDYMETG